MQLQDFLALSAASLAAIIIAQIFIMGAFRNPGAPMAIGQCALVIAVTVAGAQFFESVYGYVSLAALVVVIAPGWLAQWATTASIRGHYATGARWMRIAAFIRPTWQMRFEAAIFQARCEPTRERLISALERISAPLPMQQAMITAQKFGAMNDWAGLACYLNTVPPAISSLLVMFAIRAFGETGELDRMIDAYRRLDERVDLSFAPRQLARLMVLAFCGRPDTTRLHLASKARGLVPPARTFWLATALQAAGRPDEAKELVLAVRSAELAQSECERLELRLTSPVSPATRLSITSLQILESLEAEVKAGMAPRPPIWRRWPLTLLLIVANLVFYGVELYTGDPESAETLFALGALWPQAIVQDHEWWRLGTAMFLHAGFAHIFSNMLALWVLGGFVESSFGSWRMLVIYLLGGLASMAGVLFLMQGGIIEPNLLVGASGAIFALLGAIGYMRVSDYLRTRTIANRRHLMMIVAVLAIQFGIDLAVPQISFTAHGLGFVVGAVLTAILRKRPAAARYVA